jgi:hypothetical protein
MAGGWAGVGGACAGGGVIAGGAVIAGGGGTWVGAAGAGGAVDGDIRATGFGDECAWAGAEELGLA